MKRVLITGVGGDIGSAIARCMRNEYASKAKIYGCDIESLNQGLLYVDSFKTAPRASDPEYIPFLLDECEREKIDVVCPTNEFEIDVINAERKRFDEIECKLMLNSDDVISTFSSKYKTYSVLKALGLDVPLTLLDVGELDFANLDYPIIVKEDVGCGSRDLTVAYDLHEAKNAALHMRSAIFQQYVGSESDEYTVAVFSDGKDVYEIAFKRELGLGGMTIRAEYIEDQTLSEIASEIAESFSLKGCINIQLRKQKGKYYIFEINPRISSTVGIRYKAGFKDCIWWCDLLTEKSLEIDYHPPNSFFAVKTLDEALFKWDENTCAFRPVKNLN